MGLYPENRRLVITLSVLAIGLVLTWSMSVTAGVTGKVSGVVTDAASGKPLVGATVRVAGTDMAAVTDEDGEYFIIGVPGGKYDIVVTHVGFEKYVKKDVRVLLDLTTPVDFEVQQVTIELKDQMVVYATAPPVQKDLTASKVIFTSDRLRNLPNVQTVQAVLGVYPGVVTDRNNAMHVRGGRGGQVTYYYNGFSVQDPFVSNSGIRIIPTALEELSLTSGGFTAEYGEAISGVVSAVTPEGGPNYHGRIRSFEGMTHSYDALTGQWRSLDRNSNRSLSANVSGPLPFANPTKYNFFAAGEYLRDNSSLPHNYYVSYAGVGKLSMQPMPKLKIFVNGAYQNVWGDRYTHRDVNGRSYDYDLSGLPSFKNIAYLAGVSANYAVNDISILSVSLNRFKTTSKQAPKRYFDLYWRDWPGYSEDSEGNYDGTIDDNNYMNNRDWTDAAQATGFASGPDFEPTYRWRSAAYNSLLASWLSQINKSNEVKVGLSYRRYAVDWDFKQFYNASPYGEKYSSNPIYTSAFIQDKLEYRDIIVNLGLRYDYRNADIEYNTTPGGLTPTFKTADGRSELSPRLGVSFPVTENSVVRFNYGVYYQAPQYTTMYTNLSGNISSGLPLLGNPDLRSEQTKSYELGVTSMVREDLRMGITAYYKDMKDLVTTRSDFKVAGAPVTQFKNGDYGTAKGFDVVLERLPKSGIFSGSISYSYLIAMGNGSYALEPYYTYLNDAVDSLAPIKEYPLDFDQRHSVTAVADFRIPRNWKGSIFGLPIPGAWGVNVVGYVGSGLPYTKTDNIGNRLGERNEGRLPSQSRVDMRFNKDFAFGMKQQLVTFFIEVDNLFNTRNIINVYTNTGLPDNDNNRVGTSGLTTSMDEIARLDRLYDHDPQNYSLPRTIRTGLEYSF
ncbi:hypothetical protein C3F09_03520 [candidate division GN15 bacterium]|uniref:TonB-dependent receptor n=1 Tax=candidate division GN15 bacterium TaxID=2072418 RepID=A0A855XAA8_9BACT|nr:MAG: hypothetical protein C3F09_03520 [candidate division GN15 bacterium]